MIRPAEGAKGALLKLPILAYAGVYAVEGLYLYLQIIRRDRVSDGSGNPFCGAKRLSGQRGPKGHAQKYQESEVQALVFQLLTFDF